MPRFAVPVRQMIDGNLTHIETRPIEAANYSVAAKILALGSFEGRVGYTPGDDRPFVSNEGWHELVADDAILPINLGPYLWLAEQLSYNGITTERLARIGTFREGKGNADIHVAIENATKRYFTEEKTQFEILAEELAKVFVLNESYTLNPSA